VEPLGRDVKGRLPGLKESAGLIGRGQATRTVITGPDGFVGRVDPKGVRS